MRLGALLIGLVGFGCSTPAPSSLAVGGADYPSVTGVRVLAGDVVPASGCERSMAVSGATARARSYVALVFENNVFAAGALYRCSVDALVRQSPVDVEVRVETYVIPSALETSDVDLASLARQGQSAALLAAGATTGPKCSAKVAVDVETVALCK
jgi:hypothetical protein